MKLNITSLSFNELDALRAFTRATSRGITDAMTRVKQFSMTVIFSTVLRYSHHEGKGAKRPPTIKSSYVFSHQGPSSSVGLHTFDNVDRLINRYIDRLIN